VQVPVLRTALECRYDPLTLELLDFAAAGTHSRGVEAEQHVDFLFYQARRFVDRHVGLALARVDRSIDSLTRACFE